MLSWVNGDGKWEEMWVIEEGNHNKNGMRTEHVAMGMRERFTSPFILKYLLGNYYVRH